MDQRGNVTMATGSWLVRAGTLAVMGLEGQGWLGGVILVPRIPFS